jgi:hypothetical protein
MYKKCEVITKCEFTIQQEKQVTDENNPSGATDQDVCQS